MNILCETKTIRNEENYVLIEKITLIFKEKKIDLTPSEGSYFLFPVTISDFGDVIGKEFVSVYETDLKFKTSNFICDSIFMKYYIIKFVDAEFHLGLINYTKDCSIVIYYDKI